MLKPFSDIHLLGSPQVRHTNARQYEKHLRPYLSEVSPGTRFDRVAIIREPISWLHSWYRFRARVALRGGDKVHGTAHLSFGEFVDAFLSDPQPGYARLGSQLEFLQDANRLLGVDRLYAYENLDDLVAYFSELVGQQLALRLINVSPARVYRSNILEWLAAVNRKLRVRRLMGGTGSAHTTTDPKTELSDAQRARLGIFFAEETILHAAALRAPLLKTQWDGCHGGRNEGQLS